MISFDIRARCACFNEECKTMTVRLPKDGLAEDPAKDALFWASQDAWFGLCCGCESLPTCDYARANPRMRGYDGDQLLPEVAKIIRDLGDEFYDRMQRLVEHYSDDEEVVSLHALRKRAIDENDILAATKYSRRLGFLEGERAGRRR